MYRRRRHVYFAMMGTCLGLFVLAWGVVRLWSVPAAVAMCVVAMVIPPLAAITANRRGPEDRWWDERPGAPGEPGGRGERSRSDRADGGHDPESEAWWDELDRRGGRGGRD